ncbi:hypothetical protein F511_31247 [Dorcoceras hygrometricum]|uniref:Uncharacterized protein n=1 Tax=Dorcoceras hygrometricum TaxID=472368 RepID=A0A2Z7A754_9LAMI|nr:hypothetical protein F511_31247 [Dorcoceras hygrometricum]
MCSLCWHTVLDGNSRAALQFFRVRIMIVAQSLPDPTPTDLEATQKEVKDLQAALSKDFDDKLADIRNDILEFRVETQEQLASLGAHLAELIAFITKGSDDKKVEDSSSRPQPPPDDQNRPSGGGTVSREGGYRGGDGRRRGDSSGSSKRRRSDSGGGSGGRINYGPYLPPKIDAEYWISEKTQF